MWRTRFVYLFLSKRFPSMNQCQECEIRRQAIVLILSVTINYPVRLRLMRFPRSITCRAGRIACRPIGRIFVEEFRLLTFHPEHREAIERKRQRSISRRIRDARQVISLARDIRVAVRCRRPCSPMARNLTGFRARARRDEFRSAEEIYGRSPVLAHQLICSIEIACIFPALSDIDRYRRVGMTYWRARVSHYSMSFALFAGVWSNIASALWVRRWTSTDRRNGLIERGDDCCTYIRCTLTMVIWVPHIHAISACYFWCQITLKFFCHTRYEIFAQNIFFLPSHDMNK